MRARTSVPSISLALGLYPVSAVYPLGLILYVLRLHLSPLPLLHPFSYLSYPSIIPLPLFLSLFSVSLACDLSLWRCILCSYVASRTLSRSNPRPVPHSCSLPSCHLSPCHRCKCTRALSISCAVCGFLAIHPARTAVALVSRAEFPRALPSTRLLARG